MQLNIMEWTRTFKLFISIIFSITSAVSYAQNYRVFYDMKYKTDSLSNEYVDKVMILDVNEHTTRFYSYKLYQSDSTLIANEKQNLITMSKSMDYDFMVVGQDNKISKYHRILYDIYELQENQTELNWHISKDTKKIKNFTAQKATLDYQGRKWEAWFARELPYAEGPYVFGQLPGLIIYMSDLDQNYIFSMTEISPHYHNIYTEGDLPKTIKVNSEQLRKVYLDYYNDPYKEAKAGRIMINFKNEKGERITPNWNELTKYRQQEIKKNNNPLELSNAIAY